MYKFTSEAFAPLWEQAVSQGRWNEVGAGSSPVLVVVDAVQAYVTAGSPLEISDNSFINNGAAVLSYFREQGLPIIHTGVKYPTQGHDGGVFRKKVPILEIFDEGHELGLGNYIEQLKPEPGEVQIEKRYASVFSGTDLAAMLSVLKADTVFLMGLSTSGCVRASAVDACERGFLPVIIGDACGDRHPAIHEASLFDVGAKYGDVISVTDLEDYISRGT